MGYCTECLQTSERLLHDEYVESRVHIRGRGRAYQIEIRNDGNKDFRLAGMNSLVRNYAIGSPQG